jgi:hypothetical protein
MTLDDIDWEGAHLMVRGKGGQRVQIQVEHKKAGVICSACDLLISRPDCPRRSATRSLPT